MKGFTPYKGRSVNEGQRVKVYRNLHRGGYSIVDVKSGLVLGYADNITLFLARFTVRESGRQRVLQEKRKNVHAYVTGTLVSTVGRPYNHEAYYNPYRTETFVRRNPSGELCGALHNAGAVHLGTNGVTYDGAY